MEDQLTAIRILSEWDRIVYANEDAFRKKFCPFACIITSISWNSENMRIVYILQEGQHVSDSFKMEKWSEFLSANWYK